MAQLGSRFRVGQYLSDYLPTDDTTRQSVAGYFGGGDDNVGARTDVIRKVAFPAETATTLASVLSSARNEPAGMADCGVF